MRIILVGLGIFLIGAIFVVALGTGQTEYISPELNQCVVGGTGLIKTNNVKEIVQDIEQYHCTLSDAELLAKPLTFVEIEQVRVFCRKPTAEKEAIITAEFEKIKQNGCSPGTITGRGNSYSCVYQGTSNTGIPSYADLGLSSAACTWHDSNPTNCKLEGNVACLWGCTNVDPVLGWHTKTFSSTTALQNEIYPKGYHKASNNYGGDYRRSLPYAYSYQVHPQGVGVWHSEGPEPNPEFDWYSFLRGWWPQEIQAWHTAC